MMNTTTASTTATPAAEVTALLAAIDQLKAERTRILTEAISAADPRLATLWEVTGDKATEEGMCPVYDEVVGNCGGTTRQREYTVTVDATLIATVSITVTELGFNEDDARDRVYDNLTRAEVEEHVGDEIGSSLDGHYYTVDDWSIEDAELVE